MCWQKLESIRSARTSYKQLWSTKKVLEIEPKSTRRAASALNQSAISLATKIFLKLFFDFVIYIIDLVTVFSWLYMDQSVTNLLNEWFE